MSESGLRVSQLLPVRFENITEAARSGLLADKDVQDATLPGFVWGMVGDKAAAAVTQVLDVDVFDILAAAWQTAVELHEFTVEERHPRGVPESVSLGEHPLTATAYPVVEVHLGPTLKPRLKFTLELTAQLTAATLTIESGHITAIEAGSGRVSAQLKYGAFNLTPKAQSEPVNFTNPIRLPAPGLAIP